MQNLQKKLVCHVAASSLEGLLASAYLFTIHLPSHGFPAVVVDVTSEDSLMQKAHIAPLNSQMIA